MKNDEIIKKNFESKNPQEPIRLTWSEFRNSLNDARTDEKEKLLEIINKEKGILENLIYEAKEGKMHSSAKKELNTRYMEVQNILSKL